MAVPVTVGGVEVVDPQFHGSPGYGDGFPVTDQGKRPPACPTTVSFSPVLPKTRLGISPGFTPLDPARADRFPSPASVPPKRPATKVLRFILDLHVNPLSSPA